MDIIIDTYPDEKPECPYCKSRNTENDNVQEHDDTHMSWEYKCKDCYRWFTIIFPNDIFEDEE